MERNETDILMGSVIGSASSWTAFQFMKGSRKSALSLDTAPKAEDKVGSVVHQNQPGDRWPMPVWIRGELKKLELHRAKEHLRMSGSKWNFFEVEDFNLSVGWRESEAQKDFLENRWADRPRLLDTFTTLHPTYPPDITNQSSHPKAKNSQLYC